ERARSWNDAWPVLAERHRGDQKYLRVRNRLVMTTIMLFRIMIVVAFMIMMVMRVSGPGRKWIGEALPMFRARSHLFISKQTGIELGLKGVSFRLIRHDCK